ncbi:MAG: hypothetical protein F4X02_16790 [Chloroflexi bacterium]|nr:hypothetical protein [Chloroflexota bacterium]
MQHLARNSGRYEWYTPANIMAAAREVMGGIDLDPCSCEQANRNVQAGQYFTIEDDGLLQDWPAKRLWMNPPYARRVIDAWVNKLLDEAFIARRIGQWMVLVNNATDTRWAKLLLENSSCVCFITGRLQFETPRGKGRNGPLQGQMLCYGGQPEQVDCDAFVRQFKLLGVTFERSE